MSLTEMDIAGQAKYLEEAAAEEKAVVTWPLISAILVAVLLEFLVGYNIGVMVRGAVVCRLGGWLVKVLGVSLIS